MKLEKLGKYITQSGERNADRACSDLRGISMNKQFIRSVANTVGSDMSKYRLVRHGQFAYNPMHVGRDRLVPISLHLETDPVIVSPAYVVFNVTPQKGLLGEYLLHWFMHSDFDRRAWFTTDNSVRGGFSWESLCDLEVPIPDVPTQSLICLNSLFKRQAELTREKIELLRSIRNATR